MLAKDNISIVADIENTCSCSDKALLIRRVRYNCRQFSELAIEIYTIGSSWHEF